jgi:hypothetical protein
MAAVAAARGAGAAVAFDPGPRAWALRRGARRAALDALLDAADVVLMTQARPGAPSWRRAHSMRSSVRPLRRARRERTPHACAPCHQAGARAGRAGDVQPLCKRPLCCLDDGNGCHSAAAPNVRLAKRKHLPCMQQNSQQRLRSAGGRRRAARARPEPLAARRRRRPRRSPAWPTRRRPAARCWRGAARRRAGAASSWAAAARCSARAAPALPSGSMRCWRAPSGACGVKRDGAGRFHVLCTHGRAARRRAGARPRSVSLFRSVAEREAAQGGVHVEETSWVAACMIASWARAFVGGAAPADAGPAARGERGRSGDGCRCGGPRQVDVKDTVGCGDSFAAAVVLGYIRGHAVPPTLALANAVRPARAPGAPATPACVCCSGARGWKPAGPAGRRGHPPRPRAAAAVRERRGLPSAPGLPCGPRRSLRGRSIGGCARARAAGGPCRAMMCARQAVCGCPGATALAAAAAGPRGACCAGGRRDRDGQGRRAQRGQRGRRARPAGARGRRRARPRLGLLGRPGRAAGRRAPFPRPQT